MDFALSDDQRAMYDMAYAFGQDQIAPHARAWEQEGTIPRDVLSAAAELGLATLYVPEDKGGVGVSRLDATLVFEALSMACPSVASFISIHNMCANMIATHGPAEMVETWLPKLATMDAVISYCLT
ncbi:MAG: acyl-CoA dehydrogenase family protein, partial [Pseudomonadota bacterium]